MLKGNIPDSLFSLNAIYLCVYSMVWEYVSLCERDERLPQCTLMWWSPLYWYTCTVKHAF